MSHKLFMGILAVVTIFITSCSKDNDDPPDTSSNNVTATITIGNNPPYQFSITGPSAKVYNLLGPASFRIEAFDSNNNYLYIAVDGVTQTGNYLITSNNGISGNALTFIKDLHLASQVSYMTINPSIIDKGSVAVTSLNDHHIEGTFTATCKSDDGNGVVAQVSSGSFKGNF